MGRLGTILVGVPGPAGLLYRGRSGAGLAGRAGGRLLELLRPLETDESPFVDEVPRVDALGATWLRPELVVDLAALRVTTAGRLRQPAYRGVRSDLRPSDLATSTNTPTDSRRS
jgi:bifunctional non-homologous end joining protein LigD